MIKSHKVMVMSAVIIWLFITVTILLLCQKYYHVGGMPFWEISFEGSIVFILYMEFLSVPLLYSVFRRFVEDKTNWGKMGVLDSSIIICGFVFLVYFLCSKIMKILSIM